MKMSPEELKDKIEAQVAEAENHRPEFEAVAGRELSRSELMMAWSEARGEDFAADWESSQGNFNRWTTGQKLGHDPTPKECWEHHQAQVRAGEMHHHWPKTSNA